MKPIPPTIINSIITILINGSPIYPVRDTNVWSLVPNISNPALQNADIEWNTAIQIPLKPNVLQKSGSKSSAPVASDNNVPSKMNLVSLTIPPTLGAEIASCIVLRCIREIFLPDKMTTAAATVTTPRPPIWISTRMTVCPKNDQ